MEDAAGPRMVSVERELPFPPERVWRALTRPELIGEWLMACDFRPAVDHRFTLTAAWGEVACRVLDVEPMTTLAYSWEARGLRSVVTWTLTATDTGTRLRMDQAGFGPDQRRAYLGATSGWPRFLDNLERVLARMA